LLSSLVLLLATSCLDGRSLSSLMWQSTVTENKLPELVCTHTHRRTVLCSIEGCSVTWAWYWQLQNICQFCDRVTGDQHSITSHVTEDVPQLYFSFKILQRAWLIVRASISCHDTFYCAFLLFCFKRLCFKFCHTCWQAVNVFISQKDTSQDLADSSVLPSVCLISSTGPNM
jgi:hypothetical protein